MSFSKELKAICKAPIAKLLVLENNEEIKQSFVDQDNLYRSPPGFAEWKTHLRMTFLSGCSTVISSALASRDSVSLKVGEVSRSAISNRAPARYISTEMCEAFAQTPVPELPAEITEVFPSLSILLPRRTIYDHMGDEVFSLVLRTGELYPRAGDCAMDRETALTMFKEEEVAPEFLAGKTGVQIATMTEGGSNFWQEFVEEDARSWYTQEVKNKARSGYIKEPTERIIRIAINSLLVHIFEPELIETDSKPVSFSGRGFVKGADPMPPTWIGKAYRRDKAKAGGRKGRVSDEASYSVRAHWRRGHWHSYCIGKGRSERTVKWVRPIYVTGAGSKNNCIA